MNKILLGLKSRTFWRILVIFVVGLLSRIIVNMGCDIDVFKEYTHIISITYYGFFACFTGLVYEFCGEGVNNNLLVNPSNSLNMSFSDNNPNRIKGWSEEGVIKVGRPSAGVRGLYGDDIIYIKDYTKVGGNTNNSFGYDLKCKVYWYCWKQFSSEYNSYNQFVSSSKVSVRKDIKSFISKR